MLLFCAKKLIIPISILFLGAGTYFLFNTNQSHHTITLTDSGFIPNELNIHLGDTVTFTSELEGEFWPASNVHPTHIAYSEFDPKKPIPEGETWSFTFDTAGVWGFHDHLYPIYKGSITVLGDSADANNVECDTEINNQACREAQILNALETNGVGEALKVVEEFASMSNSTFDCHGAVHSIGEKAFELFDQGKEFEMTKNASLCGFGFYHGFMETLLLTTGDIEQARAFCAYVDRNVSATGAGQACYHGVGHGAVDGSDPRSWGDPFKMSAPGFDLCDTIVETKLQSYLCSTGVYNALEILSYDERYQLDSLRRDPVTFCEAQPELDRQPCYTNMLPLILSLNNKDFIKTIEYIDEKMESKELDAIDGLNVYNMVVLSLFHEFWNPARGGDQTNKEAIKLCRSVSDSAKEPCFMGIAAGLMKYGHPKNGYKDAILLCQNSALEDVEKNWCYSYMVPRISNYYGTESKREGCRLVEEPYRSKYCTNL